MSFDSDHYCIRGRVNQFFHVSTSTRFLVGVKDPGKETLLSASQFVAGLFSGDEVDFYSRIRRFFPLLFLD